MKTLETTKTKFVICIRNDDCDDLQAGKVYRVLADKTAAKDSFIRVVDDSGEDYLYPVKFFTPIVCIISINRGRVCQAQDQPRLSWWARCVSRVARGGIWFVPEIRS